MQIASVHRARQDAAWCGDVTAWWQDGLLTTLFIADGLGHGEAAEQAARTARNYVEANRSQPLPVLFRGCDAAMRNTRGAAMAVAVLDEKAAALTYAGVGNTRGRMFGGKTCCLHSHPGIVGGGYRKPFVITQSIHPGDLVLLWTDGIGESIDLSFVERLQDHHNHSSNGIWVADYLLDEYYSGRDDVAVLVCGT